MHINNPWLRASILPAAALACAGEARAVVYFSVEQAQQAIFPSSSMATESVTLSAEQRKAIERASGIRVREEKPRVWRVSGGGWFIVDEVLGKHEFITYAVGLTASGAVKSIEIMEYRETYGHEIRNPNWRRQFIGKTSRDPLKLDQDIKNISGATLSSRHISDGVKRLLAMYDLVLRG
jgi:FMN-binding domain